MNNLHPGHDLWNLGKFLFFFCGIQTQPFENKSNFPATVFKNPICEISKGLEFQIATKIVVTREGLIVPLK